ncbi:hypothetical protein ACFLTJ_02760 [Chloroflexota bacterium]
MAKQEIQEMAERITIMEENNTIIEARLAFCEQRLAVMERTFGGIIKSTRRRKRELTPEEKKAVRARLIAGQERKRKEREAQIKAEAQAELRD